MIIIHTDPLEGIISTHAVYLLLLILLAFGCASSGSSVVHEQPVSTHDHYASTNEPLTHESHSESVTTTHVVEKQSGEIEDSILQTAMNLTTTGAPNDIEHNSSSPQEQQVDNQEESSLLPPAPDETFANIEGDLLLEEVVQSVYQYFPSLEAAIFSRGIAAGEYLSAEGEFDLKLKAASENGPTGFYENYRQSIGFVQPIYQGGELFAGYRIGRGYFQPWYKERETNEGGEFKAGVVLPLAQDQQIDERRAELWKANYERYIVEPEIQAQLIDFIQQASLAYWEWVAAGENYRISQSVLELATSRTERIRSQVENNLLDPPELSDNLRLVAEREAKVAESLQKLQKTAIKLSLYYRDETGQPVIPTKEDLPQFSEPEPPGTEELLAAINLALQHRPELKLYHLLQEQLNVDYAQACNNLRPEIDAVLTTSQDVGFPASPKNDKGQFELEASVFVNVPVQRRKARGKIQAVEAKLAQLNAKRRMTSDKIVSEVQTAHAAMINAAKQYVEFQKAIQYADELAQRERVNFEVGSSDLLKVTLREQYAMESRQKAVDALLLYYSAKASYRAALAQDQL